MGWYLALLAGIGIVWLWRREMEPWPAELSHPGDVARMLRFLLARGVYRAGVVGTVTMCDRAKVERQLVFTKYLLDNRPGIRAEFPLLTWSEPYYGAFRTELLRRGVPHAEVEVAGRPALTFDFGGDLGGAHVVAHVLFEDILGLRIPRDCVAYFRDCVTRNVPRLTGVDAPDVI